MNRARVSWVVSCLVLALLFAWMVACSSADPNRLETDGLTLTVSSQKLEAVNGRVVSRYDVVARVRNDMGQPAPGTSVVFSASAGSFLGGNTSSVVTDASGIATELLTLETTDPDQATITATTGLMTETIPVAQTAEDTAIASVEAMPAGKQVMGNPVTFDGSGSASTIGPITMYRWTITSDAPDPGSDAQEVVEAADAVTVTRTYATPQNLTVQLEVSDAENAADLLAAGQDVPYGPPTVIEYQIVEPNEPPVADAGEDILAECTGGGSATVTLDGSGSTDPNSTPGTNDDIVLFEWFEDFGLATETLLGTGAVLDISFEVGVHAVTLQVTDAEGETATDDVVVEIVDTTPPSGSITFPEDGQCFGPADLPVTIEDDFTDICSDDLDRTYDPGPGPDYTDHGDVTVTLTVTDPSGNSASDSVSFTIDSVAPNVTVTRPQGGQYINPSHLPFSLFIATDDDDGASGGVTAERIYLDDCLIYDGTTYGNGDGLLSDEFLEFSTAELCRLDELCNWGALQQPVLRAEAEDCGGNVGTGGYQFLGSIQLRPGECD